MSKTTRESKQTIDLMKQYPDLACPVSSTGFHIYEIFPLNNENRAVAICARCLDLKSIPIDKS